MNTTKNKYTTDSRCKDIHDHSQS